MFVNSAAPSPPRFIDRVRDLIAKIFGQPGHKPHNAEPALAGAAADPPGRRDATRIVTAPDRLHRTPHARQVKGRSPHRRRRNVAVGHKQRETLSWTRIV
jgi:hypothetical protein